MLESITFLLAAIGYAGLTGVAVLAAYGRAAIRLWRLCATVILAHVALVWQVRYEWQWSVATRNGYVGFIMFHTALLLIVLSTVARQPTRQRLIWLAFAVVSVGAIGAVFKYDAVTVYRIPVLICAVAGICALAVRR